MNRNTLNRNIVPKKKNISKIIYYIVVFIVAVICIYFLIFTIKYLVTQCYLKKSYFSYLLGFDFSEPCVSQYKPASYKERKLEDEKEVYHIANQDYTYKQAKCKCESYNGRLATKNEVVNSYNKGANWCTYGWTEGQQAYYPVQKCDWDKLQVGPKSKRFSCGRPGINGGYFTNPLLRFGVNCYGIKPKGSIAIPKKPECEEADFCERDVNYTASRKLDTDQIVPFNKKQWSQYIY